MLWETGMRFLIGAELYLAWPLVRRDFQGLLLKKSVKTRFFAFLFGLLNFLNIYLFYLNRVLREEWHFLDGGRTFLNVELPSFLSCILRSEQVIASWRARACDLCRIKDPTVSKIASLSTLRKRSPFKVLVQVYCCLNLSWPYILLVLANLLEGVETVYLMLVSADAVEVILLFLWERALRPSVLAPHLSGVILHTQGAFISRCILSRCSCLGLAHKRSCCSPLSVLLSKNFAPWEIRL